MEGNTREVEGQKAVSVGLSIGLNSQGEGKTAEPKDKATCPCEGACKVEWKPPRRAS